jgi:hypothetical protein
MPVCLQVPITLYLMTHAYFCLYHALSNLLIRRVRHALAGRGAVAQVGSAAQRSRHVQPRCRQCLPACLPACQSVGCTPGVQQHAIAQPQHC